LKVEAMVDFLLALALIRSDSFSIQLGVAFVPPIFSFVLLPLHWAGCIYYFSPFWTETWSFWVCTGSCWCYGHVAVPQIHYRFVLMCSLYCVLIRCFFILILHIDLVFCYSGHAWTSDFGCSDKEEEFHWLIK
jgi:hypothetical protein